MTDSINSTDLVIGELGRRISDLSIEATSWQVRAALAEQRVRELEGELASASSEENTVG